MADKRARAMRRFEIAFRDELIVRFGDGTTRDLECGGQIARGRDAISVAKSPRENALTPFLIDLTMERRWRVSAN